VRDLEKVIEAIRQALFVRIDQIEASFRSQVNEIGREVEEWPAPCSCRCAAPWVRLSPAPPSIGHA
jgi:hypothetical protein